MFTAAGHEVRVTHRFGNPADEIVGAIEEWDPDLVVVGRRGLSGVGRWVLGSVSDRIVHHSTPPVLVVP